jgi:hypothetical protein
MPDMKFERIDKDKGPLGTCCNKKPEQFPLPVIKEEICCSGAKGLSSYPDQKTNATPVREVMKVSSEWSRADYWGMVKSRVSAFRMNYAVAPGLYAFGEPTKDSEVLVTANYKLTFDTLRRSLKGLNAWILALDTKGINVWCAAGKGTFGTAELIKRISESKLNAVVSHRRIILPQLGAVGVNAGAVQEKTGFRVFFGPVDARDIQAYIQGGFKKTKEMSTIKFPMRDRLILTPMEINPALKRYIWLAAGIFLFFGFEPSGFLFKPAWSYGLPFVFLGLIAVLAGALVAPWLLPFLPSRSFAIKGLITGILAVVFGVQFLGVTEKYNVITVIAAYIFFPILSSYLALQFTGSTTFTSMSGVKKELKIGIPIYIGAAGVSLVLMAVAKLKEWGIV